MITRAHIKGETNSTSYSRGLLICRNGKVHDFSAREKEDRFGERTWEISAVVDGSYSERYNVNLVVNEQESEIQEDHCTCPAHSSYWGLCKHCVAVLLTYLAWRKEQRRRAEEQLKASEEQRADALESLMESVGVRKGFGKIQRSSTPGVTELLSSYAMRGKVSYMPEAVSGRVRLEVRVEAGSDSMRAEFRIGIKRMYVLKSISGMVAAVQNLERVSYGAQLSFLHCLEAFAPECRPMVEYLSMRVRSDNAVYRLNSGLYYSVQDDRTLSLRRNTMDGFFDALGEQPFQLASFRMEYRDFHCEKGFPPLDLTVEGEEDALRVQIRRYKLFPAERNLYFLGEDTIWQTPLKEVGALLPFLTYMMEESDGTCLVAGDDLPVFCQELLPLLEERLPVKRENFLPQAYLPPAVEFRFYLDAPQRDMIVCGLQAVYGEHQYSVFADIGSIWKLSGVRDVKRELAANALVRSYFTAYDSRKRLMVLQGADEMYDFLTSGIQKLQKLGEVYISDALKAVRVAPAPRVTVGVSLAGELLEMNFQAEGFSREDLSAILSRYDRKKKYFRLKSGDFVDMDDDGIRALAELKEGLGLTEKALSSGTVTVPKYRAMYLDSRLREDSGIPVEKNKDFRALVRNMKTIEDNDFDLPRGLDARLREYQKRGYLWIRTLCANGFGGILADDMGLGKTLQMIAFLQAEIEEADGDALRRTLVVTPASLVYNWVSECGRFAPDLSVRAVTGIQSARREIIQSAGRQEILITSYDLLRRDIKCYEETPFFCQIIDEAQFIKNHETLGARAVKQVKAEFKMALTGTPVENQLSELWSIFDYLMPGFLYPYQRFRDQFETPIVRNGNEEALIRLQKMIRPFILRRLKKDVLKDLPDKIEKNMYARMEEEQETLYDAHVQRLQIQLARQTAEEFAGARFQVLAELTRLRQLCCDPALLYENYSGGSAKVELCLELVRNAVESGHKLLLFSQFTSMLEILTARLAKEGISYFVLTGSTPKEQRARMVEQFNQDDTSVFCISLKAGGTGLNLTGADIVIHYDPWWNVAVENQATDRAHRIGQKRVVTVYKLIAQGSIEEKIIRLQTMKKELADQVLAGEEIKTATFSREELLELLS